MRLITPMLLLLITAVLPTAARAESPLSGTALTIDGASLDLAGYTNKTVLVVNVASRCGFTKHYRELQALHEKYHDQGLVILGFPCNQFGQQEPGTAEEIKTFCETNFGVTFPLFSKIEVNGPNAHPLYAYLTSDRVPVEDQGPVKWNFEKFLIGRDGRVIARYRSRVKPSAPEVIEAVEKDLAAAP